MKTKIYMARVAMFFLNGVLGILNRISSWFSSIVSRVAGWRDWLDEKAKMYETANKASERVDFRVVHLKKWSFWVILYNLPDLIKIGVTFVFYMSYIVVAHAAKYLFRASVDFFKKSVDPPK